jgi:hypothetical protein
MPIWTKDLRRSPKDFVPEKMDGWKAVFYGDKEVAKNTMRVKKTAMVFSSSLGDLKAELCNGQGPYCENFWSNGEEDDEKIAAYEKQVTEWDGRRKLVIIGHESLDSGWGGPIRAEFSPVRFESKVVWTEE